MKIDKIIAKLHIYSDDSFHALQSSFCNITFFRRNWKSVDPDFDSLRLFQVSTECLGSSDHFYIVSYYIKWVTTYWTHSNRDNYQIQFISGINILFSS